MLSLLLSLLLLLLLLLMMMMMMMMMLLMTRNIRGQSTRLSVLKWKRTRSPEWWSLTSLRDNGDRGLSPVMLLSFWWSV